MKISVALSLFLGLAIGAQATMPPRHYDGMELKENPALKPIPTIRDCQSLLMRSQTVGSRAYSNLSSSDGLGEYMKPVKSQRRAVNTIGACSIPVVMVAFADEPFTMLTEEKLSRQLNEVGYNDVERVTNSFEANGSVRDYFLAQSFGIFQPSFDVLCTVTLSHNKNYYFRDSDTQRDVNMYAFFKDVIEAMFAKGIDFTKYERSDNPNVSNMMVKGVPLLSCICAGHSQAVVGQHLYDYNRDKTGLDQPWPHFSHMVNESGTDYGRTYNGVKFMSYFVGCELSAELQWKTSTEVSLTNVAVAGNGTFVHEFGHALGLPDFYCTSGQTITKTPQYWSVMDSGCYIGDTYRPIGYTAFERILLGWMKYTKLENDAQTCKLYAYDDANRPEDGVMAYVIKNPNSKKEFYILENRVPAAKYYPANMGNGLLIHHVYFDYNSFEYNTINNDAAQLRYTVLPADGAINASIMYDNYKNDLFPGTRGKYTSLTDNTSPQAAVCFVGESKRMGRPIYNITAGNPLTFDYLSNTLDGISQVEMESTMHESPVYDMMGRSLPTRANAARGLYIQNGVKVLR